MSQSYCVCIKCGKLFDLSEIGLSDLCFECIEKKKQESKLKKALEIANEALVKIDSSNDDMKYFNSEIDSILKEAQKQIKEVLEGK